MRIKGIDITANEFIMCIKERNKTNMKQKGIDGMTERQKQPDRSRNMVGSWEFKELMVYTSLGRNSALNLAKCGMRLSG